MISQLGLSLVTQWLCFLLRHYDQVIDGKMRLIKETCPLGRSKSEVLTLTLTRPPHPPFNFQGSADLSVQSLNKALCGFYMENNSCARSHCHMSGPQCAHYSAFPQLRSLKDKVVNADWAARPLTIIHWIHAGCWEPIHSQKKKKKKKKEGAGGCVARGRAFHHPAIEPSCILANNSLPGAERFLIDAWSYFFFFFLLIKSN